MDRHGLDVGGPTDEEHGGGQVQLSHRCESVELSAAGGAGAEEASKAACEEEDARSKAGRRSTSTATLEQGDRDGLEVRRD